MTLQRHNGLARVLEAACECGRRYQPVFGLTAQWRLERVTASYAYVGVDTDSLITYWSEGAEHLFGHRRSDVLGQNLAIIIPGQHRDAHRVGFGAAMKTPTIADVRLDVPTVHADGRELQYPVRLMVVMDAFGVALGALAVFSSSGVVGIPL